eukprot:3614953-Amphidinium_carterae.4
MQVIHSRKKAEFSSCSEGFGRDQTLPLRQHQSATGPLSTCMLCIAMRGSLGEVYEFKVCLACAESTCLHIEARFEAGIPSQHSITTSSVSVPRFHAKPSTNPAA